MTSDDNDDGELAALIAHAAGMRRYQNLTQKQVAQRMGLSGAGAVGRLERLQSDPEVSVLLRYFRALGVKLDISAVPVESAAPSVPSGPTAAVLNVTEETMTESGDARDNALYYVQCLLDRELIDTELGALRAHHGSITATNVTAHPFPDDEWDDAQLFRSRAYVTAHILAGSEVDAVEALGARIRQTVSEVHVMGVIGTMLIPIVATAP